MSEEKAFSLPEMNSHQLSLSPLRSHLSQHAVPSSLFCTKKDCTGLTTSIFAEPVHDSWSCGFIPWFLAILVVVLIAGGTLFIIRCYLKSRKCRNIEKKRKPLSPSHIVFFTTAERDEDTSKSSGW